MAESAMFKPEYVKILPIAPRIFKADELIQSEDMPEPAGLWEKRDGFLGEEEIPPSQLPPSTGRIVMAFQVKSGGGGHMRARFCHFLAEWHFRSNPHLMENK